MKISRRNVLAGVGGGLLLNTLPGLVQTAAAVSDDYKALVCVFLIGGNDGNNMIVPTDSTRYARYAAIRGDSSFGNGAIGLPQRDLLALPPLIGNGQYGIHPGLAALVPIWTRGELAVTFNVGPLTRPMTKADYANVSLRPEHLFSHADQVREWQSSIAFGYPRAGWGGRIADLMQSRNVGAGAPVMLSYGRRDLFTVGNVSGALTLPPFGPFGRQEFGGNVAPTIASSLQQLLRSDRDNLLVAAAQDTTQIGLDSAAALNPVLVGTGSSINGLFSGLDSDVSRQLLQSARIIESHAALGAQRQIFYITLGSFDTHSDQIVRQGELLGQLGPALRAFQDSMVQLGMSDQVTTFTLSDFGRTLQPASGGGSDHAWGNHHLIMGGAVRGRRFFGAFPEHTLGGPDDVSTEGRWLPTTSVEQYGATLARWFGVADADLATVFPNLRNFPTGKLGFLP